MKNINLINKLKSLSKHIKYNKTDIEHDIKSIILSNPDKSNNIIIEEYKENINKKTWYGTIRESGSELEAVKNEIERNVLYNWNKILFYYKIEIKKWHDITPYGTFEIICKEEIQNYIKELQ
jgi:hypothetical protein